MEKYKACAGIHAKIVVEMPLHNTRIPLERTIVFTERYFEYWTSFLYVTKGDESGPHGDDEGEDPVWVLRLALTLPGDESRGRWRTPIIPYA